MPEEGVAKNTHEGILRNEEILEIVSACAHLGFEKVRITGGEPLVRRGIVGLCADIAKISGIKELCLTTNGILLEQSAESLAAAGVSRVNISLDTLDPQKFAELTRGGDLSAVLRGIDAAKKAGLSPVKINCVLMRGINDTELAEFARLTDDGTTEVRFIELMPIGPAAALWDEHYISSDIVPKSPRVHVIDPVSHAFCSTCNRLRLTADGKLKPCLHSSQEYPLRGLHGAELEQAIRGAVLEKPEAHDGLTSVFPSRSARGMDRIGG
jgi:cyclic pyranopterin phosphate synthase